MECLFVEGFFKIFSTFTLVVHTWMKIVPNPFRNYLVFFTFTNIQHKVVTKKTIETPKFTHENVDCSFRWVLDIGIHHWYAWPKVDTPLFLYIISINNIIVLTDMLCLFTNLQFMAVWSWEAEVTQCLCVIGGPVGPIWIICGPCFKHPANIFVATLTLEST